MTKLLVISRWIDCFNTAVGKLVAWAIFIAILISALNAIVRKLFNFSSNSFLELQWYFYGAAFMLAAAFTLLQNEHVRIDIVYGIFKRRTQHFIDLFGHLFFLMPFATLMLYFLFPYVYRSFINQDVSSSAGGLIIWPAKAVLLIGFLLLWLQGLSEIIKKIAIIRGMMEDPHPHLSREDIAEQDVQEVIGQK